ncbi:hypothetical protein FRC09_015971 [Ceratobasidium sp. 395]|nr:hypothetical protein FRC09_015971 [Ceratobasidium sp. 395]
MYAPKEIVDAQLASGEDKPAAALVRSQWKSKQNWVIPSKTKVKKVKAPTAAPTVVRPSSPIPKPKDTNSSVNKPAFSEKAEKETHLVPELRGDSNASGSTPMPSPVVSSPVVSSPVISSSVISSPVNSSPVVPSPVQTPSLVPTVEVPITTVEDLSRVRIVKVLPSRKAAPLRTDAPPTTMAIPPAPPAPAKPSRPQPLTATRTLSSINESKATSLRSLSSTVAMTPRELAEAMNKRANKASGSGTRKVRIAPVYTLLDEKRTVVEKGQRIPPNTQYQVKDEKGTSLRITGARGMLV